MNCHSTKLEIQMTKHQMFKIEITCNTCFLTRLISLTFSIYEVVFSSSNLSMKIHKLSTCFTVSQCHFLAEI